MTPTARRACIVHHRNWTEYQLPIHATPRFPGHLQPNLPLEVADTFGLGAAENV